MPEILTVTATVNGDTVTFVCEPRQTLLEVLRGELHLTGTKEGCSSGNCGACAVLLDGRVVNSCLVLAPEIEGRCITTVEGLARDGKLSALQQAILENAAVQCGYCTPGVLISATALLNANPDPTEAEIRRFLAGNLCRCTGYDKIVHAVRAAARGLKEARTV